ncbi:MAG: WbqC family protein [Bacteroidia bacterium]|nr:WbqC family protein [Bacteroidia bacterium]
MPGEILLSTAYFPNAEYFSLIKNADTVFIEQEENYIKQTYRNRCKILSSNGIMNLSVPVMKGHALKAPVKDIKIDYSKRWQHIHLRAITSAYSRSAYFQFYSEHLERIMLKSHRFLLDLNDELLNKCLELLNIDKCILHTSVFQPDRGLPQDFRYRISPKTSSGFTSRPYIQVFGNNEFVTDLSILDLVFNMGPESSDYI